MKHHKDNFPLSARIMGLVCIIGACIGLIILFIAIGMGFMDDGIGGIIGQGTQIQLQHGNTIMLTDSWFARIVAVSTMIFWGTIPFLFIQYILKKGGIKLQES